MVEKPKKLLLFTLTYLDAMLAKGNVWYVRHYEKYFDRVYVLYLMGHTPRVVKRGRTILVSLASGNKVINLLLAPWRLYCISRRLSPTSYLSGDQVFSWWTAWMVKLWLSARIILIPVCMPEVIYRSSGRTHTGLPVWLERFFIYASFKSAYRVLTGRSFGSFAEWLSQYRYSRNKLIMVDSLVESLPSDGFYQKLLSIKGDRKQAPDSSPRVLIYVGRLEREKLVEDLIIMMHRIKQKQKGGNRGIILKIIGDGPERESLRQLAAELKVDDAVTFLGSIANERLPEYLLQADIFVSPLTGTALREAALCGLPLVAYEIDWIVGLLEDNHTALLVPAGNYEELALQVMRLLSDKALYNNLSNNIRELAWRYWSPERCRESLAMAFGEN